MTTKPAYLNVLADGTEPPVFVCHNTDEYPDPIEESSEQVARLLDQIDQMDAKIDALATKIDRLVETYKRVDAERRVETALDPMHNEMMLGPEDTARYLDSLPNETVIWSYADMSAYQKADDDTWYGTGEDEYRTDHDIAAAGPIRFLYAPQEDA